MKRVILEAFESLRGWEVLRHIQQEERLREIPVVIVSVNQPREDPHRLEASAGLFEGYWVKPFRSDDLLTQIKGILG